MGNIQGEMGSVCWTDGSVTQGSSSGLKMRCWGAVWVHGMVGRDQAGLHPHSSLGLTPFYRDRPAQAQVAARNLHFISRELKSGACRRSPRASLQGEESPAEPCLREGQRGLGKNRQRCEASRSRQCPEWQRRKACQDRLKYRSDLRWGRGYCKSLGKAHII